ncbi:MAG: hypothetical protein GTN80_09615 [Nitrososphaeria archaeon]|nr:hypothetical protein [Nitrososphaeria archaeon]NIN53113.1 hypothetical protein [Nitrososphaeria archaeon]NIQ33879.1 hypothetical protein [Nitrososphaeria archaeon]
MSIFERYAEQIEKQIRPTSYPLAVKLLEKESDIPKDAKRPIRDFGYCLSTCQCFSTSRRQGTTLAQLKEDMWCPEPVIGYGLAETPKYFLDGNNRFPKDVETLEAGSNWAHAFPRLEFGRYIGVLSAPLKTANFDPNLVMIYCNSAQLTQLLLGIAYKDGHDITSQLSGHAACVYSVVPAIRTEKCQVTVPCLGDRRRAMAQDDEMIFTVPRQKMDNLLLGLKHIDEFGDRRIPFAYPMIPEYKLSENYAKIARMMGMKKGNGTEIR